MGWGEVSGASQRAALVAEQRLLDYLSGVHGERAVLTVDSM
jgi:hypothetical protein